MRYPAEHPVQVSGYSRNWQVNDAAALDTALAWRDTRGGAVFWLNHGDAEYPTMAIRLTDNIADVHFFPEEGHPGFRCLGGEGLPKDSMTILVYEGCDPATGESTPNEFIVPVATARAVAKEFLLSKQMSNAASWFEL